MTAHDGLRGIERAADRSLEVKQGVLPQYWMLLVICLATLLLSNNIGTAIEPVDALALYHQALNGEGATAVQVLADAAARLAIRGLPPGDSVTYDPSMARNVRGQVRVADTLPVECANPDLQPFNPWGNRYSHLCQNELLQGENLVRLGRSAFLNPADDGSATPRPCFDDLLATYIEEVGHSWQE